MDDIDIDNYSRDRSRSPVRDRSPSGRRDYEAPRGGDPRPERRDRRGSGRGDRREEVRFDRRDERRGDRRDDRRRDDRRDDRRGGRRDKDDRRGGFLRRDRGDGDRRDRKDRGGYRDSDRERDRERDRDRDVYRGRDDCRDLSGERNYDNSVFVGNIPFRTTSREIEDLFGRDFRITRAEVIYARGKSRGMATVEFPSKQDVGDAIAKFDRTDFYGREIFVRQDYPPPEERRRAESAGDDRRGGDRNDDRRNDRKERRERPVSSEPPKPGCEVYVGNLPFATTWKTLKDMMRLVGDVARADVTENKWGRSRGWGTVIFDTPEDAQAAIERYNGIDYEGRQLEVRLSVDPSERRKEVRNSEFTEGVTGDGDASNVIYADNLPYITTETDLHELFETIGRVSRAEIQYNDRGRPNGTAVVEFELPDLAEVAISSLNGYNYGGRDLRISYARRDGPEPMGAESFEAEPLEPAENYVSEQGGDGDFIDEDIQDAPAQVV